MVESTHFLGVLCNCHSLACTVRLWPCGNGGGLLWSAATRDGRIRDSRHHPSRFDRRTTRTTEHCGVAVGLSSLPYLLRPRRSSRSFFQVPSSALSCRRDERDV